MKRDEDHEDGANDDAEARFNSEQRRKFSRLLIHGKFKRS